MNLFFYSSCLWCWVCVFVYTNVCMDVNWAYFQYSKEGYCRHHWVCECSLQSRKFQKECSCIEFRSPACTSGLAVGCFSLALSIVARITCYSCPAVTVTGSLLIAIFVVATIENLPLRIGLVFLASTCREIQEKEGEEDDEPCKAGHKVEGSNTR